MDDTFQVIQEKLVRMLEHINELKQLSSCTYEEYVHDIKLKYAIERLLQLIVDLALDINNMILAYLKRPPASDYFNSFIDLSEIGILDVDFAVKIAPASGLRNRLVHQYEKIDDKIVYNSVKMTIEDFSKYVDIISRYIGV
ncbi:protein of unknown function DUF86 [Thermoanaerobacterium xylanolyticum LX-11]|uniref:DUF86 domain-containing protein n=1 Tax=Thermoanaerobacterium xylanolyticum (strain ATCC 49914 / DSM 7097 / LX-11) TaxID=858215 RepID=F6BJI9_THEXL|nr:DUF86 domain-containing protein [Thermoanaerobacterium xylanolyticum]AEF17935.1 protein of unknown function DUF86 [Thermoanaerobacterium xylanolyticum LX-11]